MKDPVINEIAEDVSQAVKRALRRVSVEARNFSEDAQHVVEKTGHRAAHIAEELAHDARVQGKRAAKLASQEVRRHPVAAIAVGAALGAATVWLLSRRND